MILPKNKSYVMLFVLVFICQELIGRSNTLVNFQALSLTEASQSGKKIMVSFTADWCLPCKAIESSLYSDPEVADLVNANFQPVLIDVDSPLGNIWNESYNIDFLPSILFANASGIEFERIKKAPSKEEFLSILKNIININDVPYRAHNYGKSPKVISNLANPGLDIQLGAFSKFTTAEKRLNTLATFKEGDYSIIQEDSNGRILYKVVQMGLVSQDASESLLKYYHQNGFEAFLRPK